jgi:hypothetical protein
MDTRRNVNESRSRTLAQFRWLGWVMLMMSVLVQVAMGASPSWSRSDTRTQEGGTFDQASANFNPETTRLLQAMSPLLKGRTTRAAWINALEASGRPLRGLPKNAGATSCGIELTDVD